jgi:hypothetical protein
MVQMIYLSDPERRTLLGTDDETDIHVEHHRKDVVHMLGMAVSFSDITPEYFTIISHKSS